jgi:hypothetical protein
MRGCHIDLCHRHLFLPSRSVPSPSAQPLTHRERERRAGTTHDDGHLQRQSDTEMFLAHPDQSSVTAYDEHHVVWLTTRETEQGGLEVPVRARLIVVSWQLARSPQPPNPAAGEPGQHPPLMTRQIDKTDNLCALSRDLVPTRFFSPRGRHRRSVRCDAVDSRDDRFSRW